MFSDIPSNLVQPQSTVETSTTSLLEDSKSSALEELCAHYNIKQLSWSRNFAYPQFGRHADGHTYVAHLPKIALSNAPLNTQSKINNT